jgi:hypothetical protein
MASLKVYALHCIKDETKHDISFAMQNRELDEERFNVPRHGFRQKTLQN